MTASANERRHRAGLMTPSSVLKLVVLALTLAIVGCDRQPTTDGAVEGAKDALDMR